MERVAFYSVGKTVTKIQSPEFESRDAEASALKEVRAATPRRKNAKTMIDVCRKIVSEHQAARWNGSMIDAYSASAFCKVYDALNPQNQAKLLEIAKERGAGVTMGIVWQMIK